MCGIWAILGKSLTQEERQALLRKLEARGPEFTTLQDISGTNVTLGFTRLAINGLTPNGNQPFVKGSTYIICNGEIYNYKELANRWMIPLAEGTSDCAVIASLAEQLGMTELCRTLDGVFACVIVNSKKGTLTVARDPYGVRPLYEGRFSNGDRMWASEIKGLSRSCASVTPFPPGTWRSYSIATGSLLEEYKYHTCPHVPIALFAVDEGREFSRMVLRKALVTAVKKRLLSDRPIGALLSGGLDSSLVCSIVARELAKTGKKLHTFSIGMPGSTDLKYAQMVADHIGSIHQTILVQADDFLNAIPSVVRDIESYDITSVRASVGNWLLGKYIREHTDIKVVFNGDGSDEIGGGYLYFYKAPSNEEFEAESERLLNEIHYFDVLRSDRSMAAHGLEARTPFLDKGVVQAWRSIATEFRRPSKGGVDGSGIAMEKQILREAFDIGNWLPREVLWRKKEAFSDGVSSTSDSWYVRCSEYGKTKGAFVSWWEGAHNPPLTEEACWYRSLFEESYGNRFVTVIPHMWMPRWVGGTDPSARTLTELYSS